MVPTESLFKSLGMAVSVVDQVDCVAKVKEVGRGGKRRERRNWEIIYSFWWVYIDRPPARISLDGE